MAIRNIVTKGDEVLKNVVKRGKEINERIWIYWMI